MAPRCRGSRAELTNLDDPFQPQAIPCVPRLAKAECGIARDSSLELQAWSAPVGVEGTLAATGERMGRGYVRRLDLPAACDSSVLFSVQQNSVFSWPARPMRTTLDEVFGPQMRLAIDIRGECCCAQKWEWKPASEHSPTIALVTERRRVSCPKGYLGAALNNLRQAEQSASSHAIRLCCEVADAAFFRSLVIFFGVAIRILHRSHSAFDTLAVVGMGLVLMMALLGHVPRRMVVATASSPSVLGSIRNTRTPYHGAHVSRNPRCSRVNPLALGSSCRLLVGAAGATGDAVAEIRLLGRDAGLQNCRIDEVGTVGDERAWC
ncbi:hypothetical protein IWZ01DRAFT_124957 [Phyllosticta capitalensis]